MKDLKEILTILQRPFSLEKKYRYQNTSVFGGFDSFVQNWSTKGLESCDSESIKDKLARVRSLFSDYRELSLEEKEERVAQSLEIIEDIEQELAGKIGPVGTIEERVEEIKDPRVSLRYLKGVGPKLAARFREIGLETVEDLLFYFPNRHEDRRRIKPISQIQFGVKQVIEGKVLEHVAFFTKSGRELLKIAVGDETGFVFLVCFNRLYLRKILLEETKVIVSGKFFRKYGEVQTADFEYEIVDDEEGEETIHTKRIVPIYPSIANIHPRTLRSLMKRAVDEYAPGLEDHLPGYLKQKYKLLDLSQAIANFHFPDNPYILKQARRRLVFEELFFLQLGLAQKRLSAKSTAKSVQFEFKGGLVDRFRESLPFKLTKAQERVIAEIFQDMADDKPMSRLLQGDVGSGKTIVAVFSLLLAVGNGYQGAIMVPTEVLGQQHYTNLKELLSLLDVRSELLIGSRREKDKREIREKIESGEIDLIIGTHALIQEGVRFHKLGLVVIDEQHRFGVMQRATLQEKGLNPDILIMTATPIPRTLALTVYGDLDVSLIDEMPPGRQPIKTLWMKEKQLRDVYQLLRLEIEKGRQAYVIYPLVEESEKMDLKAAVDMAEKFEYEIFPDLRIGLIHGRLSGFEKEEVMTAFKERRIDILISTTVTEVGVDVPNATVMVIENAERFGLAQLHQLRGRVGRGEHQSYCVLVSDATSEDARERIKVMLATNDGFVIAEKDLEIRGPGELAGLRQSGLPDLKIADLVKDQATLVEARREAFSLLDDDPKLEKGEHRTLRDRLQKEFGERVRLAQVS